MLVVARVAPSTRRLATLGRSRGGGLGSGWGAGGGHAKAFRVAAGPAVHGSGIAVVEGKWQTHLVLRGAERRVAVAGAGGGSEVVGEDAAAGPAADVVLVAVRDRQAEVASVACVVVARAAGHREVGSASCVAIRVVKVRAAVAETSSPVVVVTTARRVATSTVVVTLAASNSDSHHHSSNKNKGESKGFGHGLKIVESRKLKEKKRKILQRRRKWSGCVCKCAKESLSAGKKKQCPLTNHPFPLHISTVITVQSLKQSLMPLKTGRIPQEICFF